MNVLHQTLQQILKLISFYTATDPETFFSFASCLIDNNLLQAASQDLTRCFSLSTSFTGSGIHATVRNLKCFSCVLWCDFLPREATRGAVLPRQVVRPSVTVCPSVCNVEVSWS